MQDLDTEKSGFALCMCGLGDKSTCGKIAVLVKN